MQPGQGPPLCLSERSQEPHFAFTVASLDTATWRWLRRPRLQSCISGSTLQQQHPAACLTRFVSLLDRAV
jgi:hypothetical protein